MDFEGFISLASNLKSGTSPKNYWFSLVGNNFSVSQSIYVPHLIIFLKIKQAWVKTIQLPMLL
jgi:hypothetical protein